MSWLVHLVIFEIETGFVGLYKQYYIHGSYSAWAVLLCWLDFIWSHENNFTSILFQILTFSSKTKPCLNDLRPPTDLTNLKTFVSWDGYLSNNFFSYFEVTLNTLYNENTIFIWWKNSKPIWWAQFKKHLFVLG